MEGLGKQGLKKGANGNMPVKFFWVRGAWDEAKCDQHYADGDAGLVLELHWPKFFV